MKDNVININPGNLEYDEITGCYYNPKDYPEWETEYWVVSTDRNKLGIGKGFARFTSMKAANEYRMKRGIQSVTRVITMD